MSRTRRFLQRKAIERIPAPAMDLVGKAVVEAVDRAVEGRWDDALERAAEAEGETVDERVKSITAKFRRELTVVGAATGAIAAAPGVGTAAAASALVADMGWFAMRATDLIMTIGAAHGMTEATAEQRRAWVLAVLAFGESASDRFVGLVSEVTPHAIAGEQISGLASGLAGSDAITLDALRRINVELASRVLAKYGSRRSVLAVGKLLPFGIGAAVGGGANYAMARVVGGHADRFFSSSTIPAPPPPPPPPVIEATLAEESGSRNGRRR